jgi:hypothetical protein
MLKTEAEPLELICADLAIQPEDDVAELAEREAISLERPTVSRRRQTAV